MSATAKVIITIVVVAVLGGGAYAVFGKSGSDNAGNPTASTSPSSNSSDSEPTSTTDTSGAATITFDDSGFSPSTLTVKVGATVKVVNKSSQLLQFDSDPHPDHTDETELNVDLVSPGQSKTFTVTKKGTWGFHDHLNPGLTGTLNVE